MTLPPPAVLYPLAGIWALLALASLAVFTMVKTQPEKNHKELVLRTKSWWWMIGIFTIGVAGTRAMTMWFLGILSFLALKEFFSIIPTRRSDRRVLFWAYLAIPFQYYWAAISWYGMFIIFIPVYMFLFLPFRMLITQKTEGFLKAVGSIHWGLMTCVFSISHMAYLCVLQRPEYAPSIGITLLIFLVFLTEFNDVAQYVWGRSFGKRKIMPVVSPKKTWEGFLGGVVTTTAAAVLIAPYLTPFTPLQAALAGLLISVTGFIGDVSISAIKRDIGVKDTGATIPGHGGLMDRIDSLTFTAPLFFHYTYFFCF